MSFCPAGAEDSNSDDEGFYIGSIHDSKMNGAFKNKTASCNNFTAIPAGAESDDEDSDGFDLGSASGNSVKSASAKFSGTRSANNDGQLTRTNDAKFASNSLSETSGVGRGRGLLSPRGRGRGGFPKPSPTFNSKGKTARRLIFFIHNSLLVKLFPSVCHITHNFKLIEKTEQPKALVPFL